MSYCGSNDQCNSFTDPNIAGNVIIGAACGNRNISCPRVATAINGPCADLPYQTGGSCGCQNGGKTNKRKSKKSKSRKGKKTHKRRSRNHHKGGAYGVPLGSKPIAMKDGYPPISYVNTCSKQVSPEKRGADTPAKPMSGGTAPIVSAVASPNDLPIYGFAKETSKELIADLKGSYFPINISKRPVCSGGARKHVCHKISDIKTYAQVKAFWKSICPSAVMIYIQHLKKLEKTHSKDILNLIKKYTKAFCLEVEALKSSNKNKIRKNVQVMRNIFKTIKRDLKRIGVKADVAHKLVQDRHINAVTDYLKTLRHTLKNKRGGYYTCVTGGLKCGGKKGGQKGGYYQYNSNVPSSPGYSAPVAVSKYLSAMANPVTRERINVNARGSCVDNYNHYTNKGFASPVLDKAAPVSKTN